MSKIPSRAADASDLTLAREGDGAAFDRMVAPLRRELHAHCYRMLGSPHDADDALQDASLRAWRGLGRFEARSSLRNWLYTVATRTGNQRAALLLFEVLGFSAGEIASTMDTTTASVNSALQRARRIVAEKVAAPTQQQTLRQIDDVRIREIVTGFASALERGDADGLVALLTEDATWSMPPLPHWYQGIEAVTDFAVRVPLGRCGSWRHLATGANGQPAVALYLRAGGDDAGLHPGWSINVLTLRGERIAGITSFIGPEHFPSFGLPSSLP